MTTEQLLQASREETRQERAMADQIKRYSDGQAKAIRELREALEELANAPNIYGHEVAALARDALASPAPDRPEGEA